MVSVELRGVVDSEGDSPLRVEGKISLVVITNPPEGRVPPSTPPT